jgi:ribose transport system ATP-binding protein
MENQRNDMPEKTPEVVLQMLNISKSFPGVKALDRVNFNLVKGEVHVLLGENGAGKSTLMKVLSGVYGKDEGEILIDGKHAQITSIREARALGVSIIHQELNLLLDRTIAQNIFLGREPIKNRVFKSINKKLMLQQSSDLLKKIGLDISPDTIVKDLSIAQQQMVEVVKALSAETKILIMDEPTSSLTLREIEALFQIVCSLKERGISIIYISHRLEEIFRIGDRVTVMRDGKYVDTRAVRNTSMDELIAMMVGRKISSLYNRTFNTPGAEALRTEKLCGLRFRNVDLVVRRGEIVGLAGLVGAGRTELVKAVFGYDPVDSGTIYINGQPVKRTKPKLSVLRKIGFLPEDRKNEGVLLPFSIKGNIIQASLPKLFPNGLVNRMVELEMGEKYRSKLRIASPDVDRPVFTLSGGNQQKVVLGKWLCPGCDIFMFDEPTRGIDVGAKQEIYELMNQLAAEGCAILVVSSDQMELLGISDRVYVMCDGEVVANFDREDASPEKVVACALGREGAPL